jgi:hypothetical protein
MKVLDNIRNGLRRRHEKSSTPPAIPRDLDREAKFFEAHRQDWADKGHAGEYVLIHEDTPYFFPTLQVAFESGLKRIGPKGFFIREVTKGRPVNYIPSVFEGDVPVANALLRSRP